MRSFFHQWICLLLCLALLCACAPALAAQEIPLVVATIPMDDSGLRSPSAMPELVDDLGNIHPVEAGGVNQGRSAFFVQAIPPPADKAPSSVRFSYGPEDATTTVTYTLNQAVLPQVCLYQIHIDGLRVTRVLLNSQLSETEHFMVELIPPQDSTSITLWAPAGPIAHLVLFDGNSLLCNFALEAAQYPVDPRQTAESRPTNLVTGKPHPVEITLLDVYDFNTGKSHLETTPLPPLSEGDGQSDNATARKWDLLVYPWADLTLWTDPALTAKAAISLEGGASYRGASVPGYEHTVAVLQEVNGQAQVLGYIPDDVKDIIYNTR